MPVTPPVRSSDRPNPLRLNDFFSPGVCVCAREGLPCAEGKLLKDSNGYGRELVNKAELIEALAGRLGDRKSATAALDAVLAEIQNAVTKGDKVAITGFGVFEKRVRAARTARNPRTGEAVKVKKTSVPAFRAGASFKEAVASGKVPKVAKAAPAKSGGARKTAAPAKSTAAKKAPARRATAKATKAATATRTTTTVKAAAKKAPAKKR
jgi:DNA-binding protein HU-beta